MPPVDLDWDSEDDWGSGLDWDAVDREASKRLKLTQGHAQEPQVGTGACHSARPLDAPNQQLGVNVDAVKQQQNHRQKQPTPISSLSIRQLFIKRHMPGGHQQHKISTAGEGSAAWGQQWRQERVFEQFIAGSYEPSSAVVSPGIQAVNMRHPGTLPNSRHGEPQTFLGPSPASDAQGRTPLTNKQQRLPAAHVPLQKPHQPHIGQQRSPAPGDTTRPDVPTLQHVGEPYSSTGQRFGQQALEAPQFAGSISMRLPQRFPAPPTGREARAGNGFQQGSGLDSDSKADITGTPNRMGPQKAANSWPQHSRTMQQQQQQQQSINRPGSREGDASWPRQPPQQQQSSSRCGSMAVDASANPRHTPSGGLTATIGREPHMSEAQRKQQAHVGSGAARSARDAALEEDFVLPLPRKAAAAGPQSASAPAAGRPAAALDAARAAASAPAASSGQCPQRAESQAPAAARALPASMAGSAAAALGPKIGEGPVTRALLKIGPGSSLEVGIGNYPALTAALKQVGEGSFSRFEGGQSVWRFPLASRQAICSALEAARGVRCSVEDLHPVPRAFLEAAVALPDESARYERIPAKLEERLMAFQRDGVRFALRHGGRALIGDEMGLGKTVQALALMAAFKDEWPCLIIVPSSLRDQWVEALVEWLGITEDQVHVTNCRKDTDLTGRRFTCLIASYNFLGNLEAHDRDLTFGIVIMDEAHYIKNKKSCRSQDAKPFVQKAKRAILLSGTPASGRPRELFPLIECLLPASKVSFSKFGERYCLMQNNYPRGKSFYGSKYDGTSNPDELNRVLTSCIMVRRLKKDVLSQLPPKRRTQVFLQLDADAKKQLDGMQKEINVVKAAVEGADSEAVLERVSQQVKTTILDLYFRSAKLKIKAVQEYLKELLESTDQKLLVFAHHKDLLDGIEFIMNKTKQRYIRIDGSVKTNSRQDLVDNFQNDRDIRAAVLSIHAAGTGLTLTGASVVVFAEYSWIPGNLRQAEDRAHRIGQTTSVNVYYLHVRSSVDDIMWAKIQSKLENVGQVLDGKEDTLALAATHNQVTGHQRSLRGFLQPSQASGRPGNAAPVRDDDFQTPPLPPHGSAAHHAGPMPPPSSHPMTHQYTQQQRPDLASIGGAIGRQGDMRAFLVPRGGP